MYIGDEYVLWAIGLQDESEHPFRWDMRGDNNSVSITSSNNSVISCQFGVLRANNIGTAIITVKYVGQNISKQMEVKVIERSNINSDDLKILNVDLETYGLDNTGAKDSGTTNTQSIINLFKYASENNYNKIIFPTGTYNVQGDVGTIEYPSNMIVDWNNSIIQLELRKTIDIKNYNHVNPGNKYAYHMFKIYCTKNLTILNGKFYGENYMTDKNYHIEAEETLDICGGDNILIENCEFNYAPGFNVGLMQRQHRETIVSLKLNNIEIGGINDFGENKDISTRFRTKDFLSLDSLNKIKDITLKFSVGNVQGGLGYPYVTSRIYNIYFYDKNKTFISKLKNCIQHEFYERPSGSAYCKIDFYQDYLPTEADPDFGGVVHILAIEELKNITFKKCKFKEAMSTGLSPQGGTNVLIDDCDFINCGYYDPSAQIDWEDNSHYMHGHIVRNSRFINNNDGVSFVISVNSRNIVLHNNEFRDTILDFRVNSENYRIFKNNWTSNDSNLVKLGFSAKTDAVVAYNSYIKGIPFNIGTTYGDNTIWNFSNIEI